MESFRKFSKLGEKIDKYLHHNELLIDYGYIRHCLFNQEIIKKMFKCVNCKKIRLVKYRKDKFMEDRENRIYRIFANHKNDFFPVCLNCINDGKTFVTKLDKYFFPKNTISYDKFKRIHFNIKRIKAF